MKASIEVGTFNRCMTTSENDQIVNIDKNMNAYAIIVVAEK